MLNNRSQTFGLDYNSISFFFSFFLGRGGGLWLGQQYLPDFSAAGHPAGCAQIAVGAYDVMSIQFHIPNFWARSVDVPAKPIRGPLWLLHTNAYIAMKSWQAPVALVAQPFETSEHPEPSGRALVA
jgi:hypothetical protein